MEFFLRQFGRLVGDLALVLDLGFGLLGEWGRQQTVFSCHLIPSYWVNVLFIFQAFKFWWQISFYELCPDQSSKLVNVEARNTWDASGRSAPSAHWVAWHSTMRLWKIHNLKDLVNSCFSVDSGKGFYWHFGFVCFYITWIDYIGFWFSCN